MKMKTSNQTFDCNGCIDYEVENSSMLKIFIIDTVITISFRNIFGYKNNPEIFSLDNHFEV